MGKVIVLMSTYNGEKYIEEQIESILNQVGCRVELLIRDDGSTDKTYEIIKKYKNLGQITLLEDSQNLGPARSFLKLLTAAPTSDYYAFADQDDVWDSDKLINGINSLINEKKPALYCANARVVDKDLNNRGFNVYKNDKYVNFESIVINGNFMGCTMVFNRQLREKFLEIKKSSYYIMHDYFMTIFCAMIDGRIIYDPIPHMNYRIHGNNTVGVSTNLLAKVIKKTKIVFLKRESKIAKQCQHILDITELGTEKNRNFIKLVSSHNENYMNKLKLIHNKEIKYEKINKRIEVIINILKGTL